MLLSRHPLGLSPGSLCDGAVSLSLSLFLPFFLFFQKFLYFFKLRISRPRCRRPLLLVQCPVQELGTPHVPEPRFRLIRLPSQPWKGRVGCVRCRSRRHGPARHSRGSRKGWAPWGWGQAAPEGGRSLPGAGGPRAGTRQGPPRLGALGRPAPTGGARSSCSTHRPQLLMSPLDASRPSAGTAVQGDALAGCGRDFLGSWLDLPRTPPGPQASMREAWCRGVSLRVWVPVVLCRSWILP